MLAELLVGIVRVIQALQCEVAELFDLVAYPVEGILDRHTVELGVEPFSDARDANAETSCKIFRLEP